MSRVAWDTYELPKSLGIYGGGGFDFRNPSTPLSATQTVPGEPTWGPAWKKRVKDYLSNSLSAFGHTSSLPMASNRVDLDPTLKDAEKTDEKVSNTKTKPQKTKRQAALKPPVRKKAKSNKRR